MEVKSFISTLNDIITGHPDESPVYTIGSLTGDFTPFDLDVGATLPIKTVSAHTDTYYRIELFKIKI